MKQSKGSKLKAVIAAAREVKIAAAAAAAAGGPSSSFSLSLSSFVSLSSLNLHIHDQRTGSLGPDHVERFDPLDGSLSTDQLESLKQCGAGTRFRQVRTAGSSSGEKDQMKIGSDFWNRF